MQVLIILVYIFLPVIVLIRNFKHGYILSIIKNDGKAISLSPFASKLLYPIKHIKLVRPLGLLYKCIVIIPNIILILLSLYIYLTVIEIAPWPNFINGLYLIYAVYALYFYIGIMAISLEAFSKISRS